MTPFLWVDDATTTISCSTTSANGALLRTPNGSDFQVRVYNAGTVPAFIQKGYDAAAMATTADMPMAPGSVEVLTVRNTAAAPVTHIAAITASGTASLYVTVGAGI